MKIFEVTTINANFRDPEDDDLIYPVAFCTSIEIAMRSIRAAIPANEIIKVETLFNSHSVECSAGQFYINEKEVVDSPFHIPENKKIPRSWEK